MYAARRFWVRVLVALPVTLTGVWAHAEGIRYHVDTDKPYPEVVADLKVAISEHNYRITGENVIGEALTQRHDRGFPKSLVVHFCNLEHAREILAAAPDFLLHMPCKVAVYEFAAKVRIETWMLPQDARVSAAVQRVNSILRAIVNEAAH